MKNLNLNEEVTKALKKVGVDTNMYNETERLVQNNRKEKTAKQIARVRKMQKESGLIK